MTSRVILGMFAWFVGLSLQSATQAQYKIEKHDGGVKIYESEKMIARLCDQEWPQTNCVAHHPPQW